MAKDANLHQHLLEASYPEAMVDRAVREGLWWDPASRSFMDTDPGPGGFLAGDLILDYAKYSEDLDAPPPEHPHSVRKPNLRFFSAFDCYGPVEPG
jgi:hypothetical protein